MSTLGEEKKLCDPAWLQYRLAEHLAFWEGRSAPHLVSAKDKWKCRHCFFQQPCEQAQAQKRAQKPKPAVVKKPGFVGVQQR